MSGTKQKNFFKLAKSKIKVLWKGQGPTKAFIPHPIDNLQALLKGRKMGGNKKSKGKIIGSMINARIVNGPELNILFLGIPFIVSTAITAGHREAKYQKAKKQKKKLLKQNRKNQGGAGARKPLPSRPYSDRMLAVRDSMIDAGMSEEGATLIASGEIDGEPVEEYLDAYDLGALASWFEVDTEGETPTDEMAMDDALEDI